MSGDRLYMFDGVDDAVQSRSVASPAPPAVNTASDPNDDVRRAQRLNLPIQNSLDVATAAYLRPI